MRHQQSRVLRLAAVLALVGGLGTGTTTAVHAQALFSYAAKFVCGERRTDAGVVSGVYATTVNIHNPQLTAVELRKKAVIALPQRSDRGPIAEFVGETLKTDAALGVDCRDIRALFPVQLPALIEGFVVLHTPVLLDVVGVYAARHRPGTNVNDPAQYDVESIDIEEVTPKRLQE